MESYRLGRDASGHWVVPTPHRGAALLDHPVYNKGSAFTPAEREALGLQALLPPGVNTIQEQLARIYNNIRRKTDPIEQFVGLAALQDRNEVLFHRLVLDHLEEFLPIVYTPTVGKACQLFSHLFRRARGLWITPAHRGRIAHILHEAPFDQVRLIVVTDNERILGLGDQGAGGMGIPVGKLVIYTVAAGIHPTHTLPISLDVGTDNPELLADPLYLGWRQPRLRGPEYDSLVEEFVAAVRERFPNVLLQWEDFKKGNALGLLDRYRHALPSFNDDIQGTAAVAVAGVIAGCRMTRSALRDQRILILGAGAAGIGIGRLLRDTLSREGVRGDDLARAVAMLDTGGLLIADRPTRDAYKREFAWPPALAAALGFSAQSPGDLPSIVAAFKPTVLIGTSGEPGVFTEPVVRAMAANVERPMIFPFSNPTSNCEARPADLLAWTQGRALVAAGSPFDPVEVNGRTVRIGQGNNAFIFPGVGLGVLVSQATAVPESMFAVAAAELADYTLGPAGDGALFPRIADLRPITRRIAAAVARHAVELRLARGPLALGADVPAAIDEAMWVPEYPTLHPA